MEQDEKSCDEVKLQHNSNILLTVCMLVEDVRLLLLPEQDEGRLNLHCGELLYGRFHLKLEGADYKLCKSSNTA